MLPTNTNPAFVNHHEFAAYADLSRARDRAFEHRINRRSSNFFVAGAREADFHY